MLCSALASEVAEVRMPLTAPRFTSIPQLVRASQNSVPLVQGATGPGVQALQLALVELGFSMPRSTTEGTRLPDGIFGLETQSVVTAFQRANGLKADGVVGPLTLQALDLRIVAESERRALEALGESRQRSPFI
jgi:peptidoglycan hydrolase-like protein with peptidoglycan-binding domain